MNDRFKGILFDFDGTLAKSMEAHFRAWQAVLLERGVSINEDDYYPLEGMGLHEVAAWFARAYSWTKDQINELILHKKDHYLSNHQFEFYPGVETFIADLGRKGILMGIVTGSHRDQLKQSVPSSFLDQFAVLVTGEEFAQGKPNPAPYLKGAQKLGLKPEECIAIENAPLGVQSAVSAHTYCIAVCSTVKREQLAAAHEVVGSFEDLKNLSVIRHLCERQGI